jgi:hypothetical protein
MNWPFDKLKANGFKLLRAESIVLFELTAGFTGFLSDTLLSLPTFRATSASVAALRLDIPANFSALPPCIPRSLPVIPAIIAPFHAFCFGVSGVRPNQWSGCGGNPG